MIPSKQAETLLLDLLSFYLGRLRMHFHILRVVHIGSAIEFCRLTGHCLLDNNDIFLISLTSHRIGLDSVTTDEAYHLIPVYMRMYVH